MSDPTAMSMTDGIAVAASVSYTASAGASASTVEVVQRASSPDSPEGSTPVLERDEDLPSGTRNIVEPAVAEEHVAQALKQ